MEDLLLIKYIKHECSLDEARAVLRWIEEKEENKTYFKELQAVWTLAEISLPENKQRISPYKKVSLYGVAAAITVAATFLWFVFIPNQNRSSYDYESFLSEIDSQKEIILMVDKNKPIELLDSSAVISYHQQGQILINDTIKIKKTEKSELNTIYVPYGKRSKLILSDGTLVYLNSGSSLVYPSVFDKNKREVYLNGEAFFEVKREENKRQFIVRTAYKAIEVLGTQFNVLSEKETGIFETVLVTGKIALDGQVGQVILLPNEYYEYTFSTQEEAIKEVDVSNYISWINGKLKFNKEPLVKILHKLEKVYNVKITMLTSEYDNYLISGSLDMRNTANETLDIVMQILLPNGKNKQLYKITNRE